VHFKAKNRHAKRLRAWRMITLVSYFFASDAG
jgi:hypothetical protein